MAAAIGVGLPVQDPAGNMIIDIGGGTTEVALISLSGIVFSRSVRVAGDELDEAIVQYMKRAYNLMIGERTAEEIKIKIGSAYPSEKETSVEVKGRDLVAGLPKTLMITSQEVREALLEPISTIVDSVRITLERCPPELSADLVDRGLVLAGGGALLRGFDKLLSEETGLPVHVAEDPLSAVAEGTGKCLNEIKFLRQVASVDRIVALTDFGGRVCNLGCRDCKPASLEIHMNRSSILALVILGCILAYFLTFGPESTRKLQAGFYQLISPFLATGSGLEKQITAVQKGLKSLEELERDNASLRTENRALKATNQALRDVEREVNRLRLALAYRERSVFKLVPAEIVTRDASTWWRTVTINRGQQDGIETDMSVVTDQGLVGKTTTVSDSISVVLLVSDENCKVAAQVEGTREQGIVSGERVAGALAPLLNLNFLSKQANLQPGQKVYTSGVGGVFPSGLLVGVVKEYKVRDLDGQARVIPAVDLAKLEDVFVVTGRK